MASSNQIFLPKSTCIASLKKILGFETIQSLCRFKIFGIKVLVSLHLGKFRGLKRYNRFADSNFLHKSTCIASSLKTSGIWSDTIALVILFPSERVSESHQSTLLFRIAPTFGYEGARKKQGRDKMTSERRWTGGMGEFRTVAERGDRERGYRVKWTGDFLCTN